MAAVASRQPCRPAAVEGDAELIDPAPALKGPLEAGLVGRR